MQHTAPANQAALTDRMKAKIAEIDAVAHEIPGVIIIHSNSGMGVEYMSQRGLDMLGVTLEELIAMGPAYYDRFFNAEEAKDYVPKIIGALERNDHLEWVTFFQQVRTLPDHEFTWYASSTKIFMRDDQGNPVLNITIAVPLDLAHHNTTKVDRLQKENEFLRNNYSKFSKLTDRERDILKLTALGKSSNEVAETLFISTATVDTHRKNIKKKLGINSSYELAQYAMAFDLI
ncbi:helix-turn-helix transcriptional regulator [Adhaeribacter terreus]|uniref:LuxR C-terminal-related transcriptional regulator n=1 Tax=Adhaeribacter terreus TaxID=529703 RepID=A0ABW0EHK2_9BACT